MVFAPASKRTLSVLAIVSLGFTLVGVFTGLIPPIAPAQAQASLLFALHAGKGWIVADKDSKTGYKLFLAETQPHVIWFTDRPERESGTMLTAKFVQEWSSFFPSDDEPNAVVMASGLGDVRDSVVEMLQPVYDPRVDGLIADVRFVGQDDSLMPADDQPVEIGVTDLFIDDATAPLPASDPNAPAPVASGAAPAAPAPAAPAPDPAAPAPAAPAPAAPAPAAAGKQPLTTSAAAGATTPQVVPFDPMSPGQWYYHVMVPDPRDDKYIGKAKLANRGLDESSANNYIFSMPAVALVSNFSDHHLMIANESLGISLHGQTFVDSANSGSQTPGRQ